MDETIWSHVLIETRVSNRRRYWSNASRDRRHGERGSCPRRQASVNLGRRNPFWRNAGIANTRWRTFQEDAKVRGRVVFASLYDRFLPLQSPPCAPATEDRQLLCTSPNEKCSPTYHRSSRSSTKPSGPREEVSLDPFSPPSSHVFVRYSASVVMALAYGKHPKSYDDPDVIAVNRCLTRLGNTLRPGVWRVDVFPFLRSGDFQSYFLSMLINHDSLDTSLGT